MKTFNRRELVKGILSAPFVSVASKFGFATVSTNTFLAPPPMMSKFNVVVHGLAAIVIKDKQPNDGVQIFMPDNGVGHKHLVGSYYDNLNPNVLAIDSDERYVLEGLNPAQTFPLMDIDRTQNAVISGSYVDTSPLSQWRSVVLPYPATVRTFRYRRRKDKLSLFSGNDADLLGQQPGMIAMIHVLTYDVKVGTTPVLKDNSKITIWSSVSDPKDAGVGNCHFYNEPNGPVDFCHPLAAFRAFRTINRKSTNVYLHLDFNIADDKDGMAEDVGTSSVRGIDSGRGDLKDLYERTSGAQGANCVKLIITP